MLSGACDVTKGLPQVCSATIPVLSGACDDTRHRDGEGLKKAGIGKDEQLSSVADNNASSVTCIPNSCFYPGGRVSKSTSN